MNGPPRIPTEHYKNVLKIYQFQNNMNFTSVTFMYSKSHAKYF